MYNGIKSIDHPVVAVDDMESSKVVYEKLGFMVPPRGSHVEWGTGNWCIMFANDYFELRGILDPERYTINLDKVLDQFGEGLMGVAFGTDSAQGNYDEMLKNGLQAKEVKQLSRNFELEEGWTQPSFSLCFPQEQDILGLMHVVMCQHMTPELIRKPEYLIHPNGVTGVISVTGIIEDIDDVEVAMGRLLGKEAINRSTEGLTLTLPSQQTINLLTQSAYDMYYGPFTKNISTTEKTYLGATTLKVDDITKIQFVLNSNNIPFIKTGNNKVMVAAAYTCGVALEFIE